MKAPHQILIDVAKANPRHYRQMCATARNLMGNPAFLALKKYLDGLTDRNGLSFTPVAGATQIDPLLAALREGAKIYPTLIELLADSGELENPHDGNAGVEREGQYYQPETENDEQ